MAKFSKQVALHDSSGKLHQFGPGDSVPAWAKDRVRDHVLDKGKAADEEQASTTEEEAPQEEPQTDEDEEEVGASEDKPDFTKPAPKRKAK